MYFGMNFKSGVFFSKNTRVYNKFNLLVDVCIHVPCKVDQIKKGCLHKLDH